MNNYKVNPAIILMLLTAFLQSGASFIVRGVSGDITTGIQVLSYYLVPLIFFLPMLLKNGFTAYKTKNFGFYLARGIFSAGSVFCFFYASQHIQLGVAAVLFNTTPVFIPLLASIFLNEKSSRQVYFGILLSIIGVVIIIHPGFNAFFSRIAFIGLASGFLMAVSQVMLRSVAKKNEPVNKIVFYQYFTCSLVAVAVISIEAIYQHNLRVVEMVNLSKLHFVAPMLLLLGSLCLIGQRVLAKAFQYMPAAKLAPFLYISVPISSIVGWLVWGQTFTTGMALGAVLVIMGVCVITFERKVQITASILKSNSV